ncbi:MAG TPA: hypothetical protein VEV43_09965 [Actinomycetota bacterium]|nr:hypothetical protein [Actinomycetota bacterium]
MLRSRLIVPFALAAVVATAVPAGAVEVKPEAALPTCQSAFSMRVTEYHETHYMTGTAAVPGATEVRLTCGLVRWGETVATISDRTTGPVAVVAGSVTIMGALHDICYVIQAWYPDGTYRIQDTCP